MADLTAASGWTGTGAAAAAAAAQTYISWLMTTQAAVEQAAAQATASAAAFDAVYMAVATPAAIAANRAALCGCSRGGSRFNRRDCRGIGSRLRRDVGPRRHRHGRLPGRLGGRRGPAAAGVGDGDHQPAPRTPLPSPPRRQRRLLAPGFQPFQPGTSSQGLTAYSEPRPSITPSTAE